MKPDLCLNIGAGRTFIPGFTNIDISSQAEISLDIGRDNLPFEDNSVDIVFTYHTLEHVDNYLFALGQLYRVLKHGGWLLVGVPYVTSTEFNLVNPYHQHNFSEYSFDFFDPEKLKGSAAEDSQVQLKKVFHRYHYTSEFESVAEPMRTWCRRHLFNVVKKIDFGLLAIKNTDGRHSHETDLETRMKAEFDRCLSSRKHYLPE